jgi:hypothetical protein
MMETAMAQLFRRSIVVASASGLLVLSLMTAPANADGGGPDYSSDQTANAVAAQVGSVLMESLQDSSGYAGVRITEQGLILSVTDAPTSDVKQKIVDAQTVGQALSISSGGPSSSAVPVQAEIVKYTDVELTAVTDQISTDAANWREQGVNLTSWGPDVESNTVLISLENCSSDASARLLATYGDIVSVDTTSTSATSSSRTNDIAPWFGGGKMTQGGTSCTLGFSATRRSDGKTVMLTAGHCGGGTWKNGDGSATIGTASQVNWLNGRQQDSMVIPVTSNSATIFSDPTSTTRSVTAIAPTTVPVGTLVCTDGVTDREVCSVKITALNQDVTYSGTTVTGLTKGHQTAGKAAFSAGDSGGPVGATSGSNKITAYGIINARVTTDASYGWFTPAWRLMQDTGTTIKTTP